MNLEVNGQQYPVNGKNTVILYYPNDILNGLYVNLCTNYMFIPAEHDMFADVRAAAIEDGVQEVEIPPNYNPENSPHKWVIEAVGKLVVEEAERIVYESGE